MNPEIERAHTRHVRLLERHSFHRSTSASPPRSLRLVLTARQLQILILLLDGFSTQRIAERLGLADRSTVNYHLRVLRQVFSTTLSPGSSNGPSPPSTKPLADALSSGSAARSSSPTPG